MAPLKGEVESLDEVPEGAREFYTEQDGRYVLDAEGVVPKKKLDEFRDTNISLRKRLEALDGLDPDEYKRLKDEAKERDRRKAEERGEYERLLGETREEYEARIKAKEEALAAKESQLRELVRDRELTSALAQAGLKPEAQDVALTYASKFVDTREIDGRIQPVVVGGDGKPRLNKDGDEMSIADFVEEFRASGAGQSLFKGEVVNGSGAAGKQGAGGSPKPNRSEMTTAEKAAFIAEHGRDVFLELPA